jgi:multiple sugar transport system permease protein
VVAASNPSTELEHPEHNRHHFATGRATNWILNLALVGVIIVMSLPFYWVLITSIVPQLDAFGRPPNWFPTDFSLESFRRVFDSIPFWRMFLNSIKVSLIITVGSVFTSTLAAYAFARLQFPGRDLLFVIFLAALMIPGQVTIIPTFIIIRELGLMNTHEAIYIPALVNVFGIFLLRQFFMRTPRDLEDAARIDGAGYMRVLFQIAVPLAAPAISALAVLNFQAAWNDFFAPNLFLTSPEMFTLPVGLVNLQGQFGGTPTTIFAAITLVLIPVLIVFLLAQRRLTESIALTGIRG